MKKSEVTYLPGEVNQTETQSTKLMNLIFPKKEIKFKLLKNP